MVKPRADAGQYNNHNISLHLSPSPFSLYCIKFKISMLLNIDRREKSLNKYSFIEFNL